MSYMNFLGVLSIFLNIALILIVIIRSPNEQSLQENLAPFKIFESSSKAERSLDKIIQLLIIFYFILALFYNLLGYF